MCVFSRSYKWLTNLPEHKMIALPVDIREELIAAACLLPIAVANLRSPLSTVVTCSDATPVRAGVTKAVVSRKCAEALFLHSAHKGQYTRLDWGPDDWSPQVWDGHHLPQVLSEVVSGAEWEICGAYDFHTIDHVNIQEARAMKSALNFHVAESSIRGPSIVLNGTDSRVCLGSWAKGRSSAVQLNNVWRQCLGLCVLSNSRLVQFWLPSADNPADDPSRKVDIRKPCLVSEAARQLLVPERRAHYRSTKRACHQSRYCLEVFAGSGRLSAALE